jgi:hypothetical protein
LLVDDPGDGMVDDEMDDWLPVDALAARCETPPDATPDPQAMRHTATAAASNPRTTIVLFTTDLFGCNRARVQTNPGEFPVHADTH